MPGHLDGEEPATAPPWLPVGPDPDPTGAEDVTDEIAEDILGLDSGDHGSGDQDSSDHGSSHQDSSDQDSSHQDSSDHGLVDPSWGPPQSTQPSGRSRLRRLLPGVVIVLAVAFLFGASAWTLNPTPALHDEFLPSDGQHGAIQVNGRAGQVEHGLGPPKTLTSEGLAGNVIANDHPPDWWYDGHLYRVLAHSSKESVQVIFGVTDESLTLEAIVTAKTAFVSLPGLVLSGDQEDRQHTWQAKGSAGLTGQRETEFTAEVARTDLGDCSTWTTDLKPTTGRLVEHITLELCRGSGLKMLDYRTDSGEAIRLEPAPAADGQGRYDGESAPSPVPWDDLQDWNAGAVEANSTDGLGRGPIFVQAQVPPVVLPSGLILMANIYDQDLIALEAGPPKSGAGEVRWRAHPGGTLVAVVAAGDLTIVATTQRQLVAYDETGRRVWMVETPELVTAMTMAGRDRVVTSLGSGEVAAVDVRDGHALWSAELPGVGNGQIVGNAQIVGVADATGTVLGLDAETGQVLTIRKSVNAVPLADLSVSGTRLITLRTSRLEVFELRTDLFVWGDTLPASGAGVAATDDVVVYGGPGVTRVAALADGHRVADLPPSEQVRSLNGQPILVAGSQVQAIGPDGSAGPIWDLGAELESIYQCRCALGQDGLVFFLPDRLVVIR